MKRHLIPSGLLYLVGTVAFAACSTSKVGLEGPPGPPGAQGPQGPAGVLPVSDGGSGNDVAVVNGDMPPVSARAQRGLEISPVAVPTAGLSSAQAEQLGLGSYLVNAVGACPDCHTSSGPSGSAKYLAGGLAYAVDNGAVVYARNLTPDPTTGMTLTQDEFVTALTTGQDFSDKSGNSILLVMAWSHFRWLTPDDLKAIYAYLKAIPAVANQVPTDTKQASTLNGPPVASPPTTYDEGAVQRPFPPPSTPWGSRSATRMRS